MFFNAVAARSSPMPNDNNEADNAVDSLTLKPLVLAVAPSRAITPAISFASAFELFER